MDTSKKKKNEVPICDEVTARDFNTVLESATKEVGRRRNRKNREFAYDITSRVLMSIKEGRLEKNLVNRPGLLRRACQQIKHILKFNESRNNTPIKFVDHSTFVHLSANRGDSSLDLIVEDWLSTLDETQQAIAQLMLANAKRGEIAKATGLSERSVFRNMRRLRESLVEFVKSESAKNDNQQSI